MILILCLKVTWFNYFLFLLVWLCCLFDIWLDSLEYMLNFIGFYLFFMNCVYLTLYLWVCETLKWFEMTGLLQKDREVFYFLHSLYPFHPLSIHPLQVANFINLSITFLVSFCSKLQIHKYFHISPFIPYTK